ncbi:MAG: histidine--tRNA ligase [Anaerolineae bacterium]|nr:histidine--tRNA ligase [Anaerolineae bacterium]NUQ05769.1 histidine--tRNA ligase [Anaerolineae bacterium]
MPQPKIQPRLPKGMRDFLPADMIKREYVFSIVREVFHLFGFEPLQTPVLELHETLMGKYGEDAEKLIFNAQHPGGKEELALRYDLTVPLARVVAQYQNEISLPFRRYQLSPVWRAERPQRGRYREFYQCDADIVGAAGMNADAEIVALITTVLRRLGIPQFTVKINNRKLLTAIGKYAGVEGEALANLYRSVDKFDKIGVDGVREELIQRGLPTDVTERVMTLVAAQVAPADRLDFVEDVMGSLPEAQVAIRELRELTTHLDTMGVPAEYREFDQTMVRGLGYYTGPIFETLINEPNLGSVTGGGRYDDLVGLFRGESLPTTGTALGIERIIDVMDILNLYPPGIGGTVVEVFVAVFDETTRAASTALAAELRAGGVRTELYMQDKNVGKQMAYADKKGVPVVALLGADEIAAGVVKFKRLRDGAEISAPRAEAAAQARALIEG